MITVDTSFVSNCHNLLTFRTAIDDYHRAIQISPTQSNDLRADRRYPGTFPVRSVYKRTVALSSFTILSSCIHDARMALNESANELSHTRWFYWRTNGQNACSASWLWANRIIVLQSSALTTRFHCLFIIWPHGIAFMWHSAVLSPNVNVSWSNEISFIETLFHLRSRLVRSQKIQDHVPFPNALFFMCNETIKFINVVN